MTGERDVFPVMITTHQTEFWVPVRVSYLHSIGNLDENPNIGLMCFDHEADRLSYASDAMSL